ncbi:hypothetical protein DPX16_16088 [Anabarilius grahami]|uniref:Uncharacterized protein n=1 Tax=Anabarilius grahami TaxID=495550 RepID=A0A3N0YNC7_ANAGA|nr:hypothetical protein DPX16_16088 [Anabarilius grahami]
MDGLLRNCATGCRVDEAFTMDDLVDSISADTSELRCGHAQLRIVFIMPFHPVEDRIHHTGMDGLLRNCATGCRVDEAFTMDDLVDTISADTSGLRWGHVQLRIVFITPSVTFDVRRTDRRIGISLERPIYFECNYNEPMHIGMQSYASAARLAARVYNEQQWEGKNLTTLIPLFCRQRTAASSGQSKPRLLPLSILGTRARPRVSQQNIAQSITLPPSACRHPRVHSGAITSPAQVFNEQEVRRIFAFRFGAEHVLFLLCVSLRELVEDELFFWEGASACLVWLR